MLFEELPTFTIFLYFYESPYIILIRTLKKFYREGG